MKLGSSRLTHLAGVCALPHRSDQREGTHARGVLMHESLNASCIFSGVKLDDVSFFSF